MVGVLRRVLSLLRRRPEREAVERGEAVEASPVYRLAPAPAYVQRSVFTLISSPPASLEVPVADSVARLHLDRIRSQAEKLSFDEEGRLLVAAEIPPPQVEIPNIDVALSTRASESTLLGIKAKTDQLSFDADGRLRVAADVQVPNIDVPLSTRASESTLQSILSRLNVNLDTRASESTLTAIRSQTDRLAFDTFNRLRVSADVVANPSNLDVALSTRASESTLQTLSTLVSKETKQDTVISQLSSVLSKLDSILASLGAPKPTFSATVTASAVAANKHHLVLYNGGTSVIAVRRIIVHAEVTAAVTGFEMAYRVYRVTTVSGGTAVSIGRFDTTDAVPSGVAAVTNPTSVTLSDLLMTLAVNPEETGGQHMVDVALGVGGVKPIVLRPGEGITIQQYGTAGAGTLSATIVFTVE